VQGRQEPPPRRETPQPDAAKARLRARLLAQRRTCQPSSRPAEPRVEHASLAGRIMRIPEIASARCVAAYVALPGEPDLGDLLPRLLAQGTRVLLPVLRADLDLDFREHVGTLVPGALGTREPPPAAAAGDLTDAEALIIPALAVDRSGRRLGRGGGSYDRALARAAAAGDLTDAEALIIPALAVDRSGRRLGRGGGSYDRALARSAAGAAVIAVVYDQELLDRVPTEPHDRSVTMVVTPSRTLRCEPSDGTREHLGPSTS